MALHQVLHQVLHQALHQVLHQALHQVLPPIDPIAGSAAATDWPWPSAHCMTAIGEGYVWPHITVYSDGYRMMLAAKPSAIPDAKPFRYTKDLTVALPASDWEQGVDAFLLQMLERLGAKAVRNTNLQQLWDDLCAERTDARLARLRKLEALLGYEPDTLDQARFNKLQAESAKFGADVVDEVMAMAGGPGGQSGQSGQHGQHSWHSQAAVLSVSVLAEHALSHGVAASQDHVTLQTAAPLTPSMMVPAWQWGVTIARQLRRQEQLDGEPIADSRLAEMVGIAPANLQTRDSTGPYAALALAQTPKGRRIALRAKRRSGRRFELARLLGDQLFATEDKLHPATPTYTYRQKAQRAFAAELLSPAATVIAALEGQYEDEEQRENQAERFGVSPWVIETLLLNNKLLNRTELEDLSV